MRAGRSDRGSATVVSLGLVAVLLAVFAAVLSMDRAVTTRHRAGAAADLAALAAADHALDGERTACALAARVASAQGAALRGCTLTGEVSEVVVAVGRARVRSRAGPPWAGPCGSAAGPPSAAGPRSATGPPAAAGTCPRPAPAGSPGPPEP